MLRCQLLLLRDYMLRWRRRQQRCARARRPDSVEKRGLGIRGCEGYAAVK